MQWKRIHADFNGLYEECCVHGGADGHVVDGGVGRVRVRMDERLEDVGLAVNQLTLDVPKAVKACVAVVGHAACVLQGAGGRSA